MVYGFSAQLFRRADYATALLCTWTLRCRHFYAPEVERKFKKKIFFQNNFLSKNLFFLKKVLFPKIIFLFQITVFFSKRVFFTFFFSKTYYIFSNKSFFRKKKNVLIKILISSKLFLRHLSRKIV